MSDRWIQALSLLGLAALALYCALRLELTESMAHFLPRGEGTSPPEVAKFMQVHVLYMALDSVKVLLALVLVPLLLRPGEEPAAGSR